MIRTTINNFSFLDTIKQLREAWTGSKDLTLDNEKVRLYSEPFPCCGLKQFLEPKGGKEDLANLIQELDDLDYAQKNNDLYKFRQSGDLKHVHSPLVRQFRYYSRLNSCIPESMIN